MSAAADVLFGKTRQAVLAILFAEPQQGRFLRELSRQTSISPGALQHELGRLVMADLVTREADGNRVRYRANTRHPVYTDLHAMVEKTCGLPAQLAAALGKVRGVRFACLYGSLASNSEHARSDADLLVVGDARLETLLAAIEPVERRIAREISVRLYTSDDFRHRREQRDPFLTAVLAGSTKPLIGGPDGA